MSGALSYEKHKIVVESRMCGRMFKWSVKRGYDSEEFCRTVMTSEWGIPVMDGRTASEWSDELFLLSGFETYCGLSLGECYPECVMQFIGYLYKYWVMTYKVPPPLVYKIASPIRILSQYSFLHTQGYDYIVDYLTEEAREQGII